MTTRRWIIVSAVVCSVFSWNLPRSIAATCSATYSINLTVDLSPELTNRRDDVLIELRQGSVGTSKVVDKKDFKGQKGSVIFNNLCTGTYFIDIGNGDSVAVGPTHQIQDGEHINSTIRVSFSSGNVSTMNRRRL